MRTPLDSQIAPAGTPWLRTLAAVAMTAALLFPAFAVPNMLASRQTNVMDGMKAGLERASESEAHDVVREARRVSEGSVGEGVATTRRSLL